MFAKGSVMQNLEHTSFVPLHSAKLTAPTAADDFSPSSVFARTENHPSPWIGWAPLLILPALILAARAVLLWWAFMWLLAMSIFAGCKWQTWWQARDARF